MTTEDALLQLGNSTADAVLRVLSSLAPDAAEKGSVAVIPGGASPLQGVPLPAVATNVSYVDGVTGGNVFVITRLGARRLAATMMMQEPPAEDHDGELDDDRMQSGTADVENPHILDGQHDIALQKVRPAHAAERSSPQG